MGKIDVLDLDISIAKYICKGLKKYIKENEKAVFPTAPDYTFFEGLSKDTSLEDRVKEWHLVLNKVAEKFDKISNEYKASEEDVNDAFDELKRVYKGLWI